MTRRSWLRAILLAIGSSPLVGCGRKTAATIVRGQILYRSEPVAYGLVAFTPNIDRGSDGTPATAILEADGSFALTAETPIQPGWYRIAVAPRAGTVASPSPDRPYPGLPAKYRNPSLSGLEHEIRAGVENLVLLDLHDG